MTTTHYDIEELIPAGNSISGGDEWENITRDGELSDVVVAAKAYGKLLDSGRIVRLVQIQRTVIESSLRLEQKKETE